MNKEFAITDLFIVTGSVTTPKSQLNLSKHPDSTHLYPYITTQSVDNGIAGYSDIYTEDGNVLTVDSAVLGTCFYQQNPFTASDHVEKLIPKFDMDETLAIYFVAVMNKMAVELGYSYQKKRSQRALRGETLILPADDNGNPDWQYMRDRITELERDRITELERDRITELDAYLKATGLDDYELTEEDKKVLSSSKKSASDEDGAMDGDCGIRKKKFRIGDLFDWSNGNTDLKKMDINGRGLAVISSGVSGCGIIGCTDIPARIQPAHTITVDMFGYAFYRDFEYKEVTHARVFTLIPKGFDLNERTGNYIVAQLKWLPSAYSYNNMCTYDKLKDSTISLPVTSSGEPDWDYMEKYIRAMEKVVIADVVKWKDKEIEATKKIVG